jgi:predicted dehydrogenase
MKPTLQFGILGCAQIAHAFVPAARTAPGVSIAAVASRSLVKAQAFARQHMLPLALGSYEELLRCPLVNTVYNPLPNSLHAQWSIKAAENGKHILCEKPLALNRAEAQRMFDAARANGVMLLEAYPYYFQPNTGRLLQLLRSGAIGEVQSIQAGIGFGLRQPVGNIRLSPELGGGAMMDAGCYPLSLINLVMGQPPVRVQAQPRWASTGVDMGMTATLTYADGRCAQLVCAMDVAPYRQATIVGTQGVIEYTFQNHTAADAEGGLRLRRLPGAAVPVESYNDGTGNGFRFAAEAFAQVVARQDTAAIDRAAQASLDIAATLQALLRSAREGCTATL